MGKLRSTSLLVNINSSSLTQTYKIPAMKMFIAFALLIATVAALPVETERRTSEKIVAQPEGVASDAISAIAATIDALDISGITTLAGKVGDFEGTAPGAVAAVQAAMDALVA